MLTVDQADVRRLLHVTRAVDPAGTWAMAAMPVDADVPDAPPVLAVDSARLGRGGRLAAGVRRRRGERRRRPAPRRRPSRSCSRGTQIVVDIETFRDARASRRST